MTSFLPTIFELEKDEIPSFLLEKGCGIHKIEMIC